MKIYVEDFTLKHVLLSVICTREIFEKFVYEHSETMEYTKNQPTFKEIYKLHGHITPEFLMNAKCSGYSFYINMNI